MATITRCAGILMTFTLMSSATFLDVQAGKPGGGGPSAAQSNPAIAFVATQKTGRMDVIVSAADLSSEIVLTAKLQPSTRGTSRLFGSPAWSADGTKVAFCAQDVVNGIYSKIKLYVAKADGSASTLVRDFTTRPGFDGPASMNDGLNWTPSGRELIYTSSDRILCSIDAVTGNTRVVIDGFYTGYPVGQPALSPDLDVTTPGYQGTLAVTGDDGTGNADVFLVPIADDANGYLLPVDPTLTVNLTSAPGTAQFHPSWSPDGSEIAYFDNGSLAVLNLVTDIVRHLPGDYFTHVKGSDRAAWSSDARFLVYRSESVGITDLTIASADGLSAPANYTASSTRWEEAPTWNPRWNATGPGGF